MIIDARNLDCPQPVVLVKKAMNEAKSSDILEVLANSEASIQNIKRLSSNEGWATSTEEIGSDTEKITLTRGFLCDTVEKHEQSNSKTLLIAHDKLGDGELGEKLMFGMLEALSNRETVPENIILLNRGVLLSSAGEDDFVTVSLKRLAQKGCKIYSCGVCLQAFDATGLLKVGEIGNPLLVADILMSDTGVVRL